MSCTEKQGQPRKVVIVGAGDVWASFAYRSYKSRVRRWI